MASKELRSAYAYTIAGIVAIALLAILFSGRVAGVSAGLLLLGLAGLRASDKATIAISSRSTRFDTALLIVLGVGILFLALTADNI